MTHRKKCDEAKIPQVIPGFTEREESTYFHSLQLCPLIF